MWHNLRTEEVASSLKTSTKLGLTKEEIIKRREKNGKNKLEEKNKESIIVKFIKQFNDFMIIILILAAIISAFTSYTQGLNDYIDSIIIIAIVVLNAVMGLVQEERAEKSIESLKKLTPQIAKTVRSGKIEEINSEELVPGDIIELESGNYVPADCRIIEAFNLKIEESSLTGENEPSEKSTKEILKEKIPLGDMKNMGFMGSAIISGHGKAIVTETGMSTKIGKIANMIIEEDSPETPIQRKLSEVGKDLGIICLVICAIIYIIGILKKIPPIEMFMTSVGLAVAAIPEGLPAIVTIMLSIGVTKMAKKKSIIRKLPAVETLGCSNVICSDKTGTLTQNKMTIVRTIADDEELLLQLGSLCTDCEIRNGNEAIGEPTEVAIVNGALKRGINKTEWSKQMQRVSEIPFDSSRKLMTTVHRGCSNGYKSITKGAPEILIEKCDRIYINGKVEILTENEKRKIKNQNVELANNALRVIAVAYRDLEYINKDKADLENNLVFVGLIGMIDPPREGVIEAIKTCKRAGIKTVMITGDHIATAKAIAKELGILELGEKAITGENLDNISDNELMKNIDSYSVFARVTPEHKVRIVKAWQRKGAVVAMTGDGVNDSPALKNADIGIAMGKGGTDVAKNAADMILMDDNFVTIVEAIRQGRNIYDNIKKAIHFLISTNIGEITTIFLGLVLGLDSPLIAIQLLWVNLVTDSFPAIALGLEKEEAGIMERKPRDSKKSLFADGLWNRIITEGIMLGTLNLVVFYLGNNLYGIDVARTMAFVSLGFLELIHSINIKSEDSIFKSGLLENKFLIGSIILGGALQMIVVIVPCFAKVFGLVSLNIMQWMYLIGFSLIPIIVIELQKKINKFRKMREDGRKLKIKKLKKIEE